MMRRKLRSERGASITFALLLFLVCAMVSSVVIVAATAAGGRLKNLPEVDQRYYAVSSATELLSQAFDEKSVTVVKTTETTETTKIYDQTDTLTNPDATPTSTTEYYVDDDLENSVGSDYSMLTEMAEKLTTEYDPLSDPFPVRELLTLTATSSNADLAVIAETASLSIYEQLEKNGTLTFYISKGESATSAYTLRMTFAVDRTDNTTTHTEHGSKVMKSATEYTVTDIVTEEVTTTFKWTLLGVVKDTAPTGWSV